MVLQQVKDGSGNIEPGGRVEGGEAVLVGEVGLDVGLLQQVLPHMRMVVSHSSPQRPPSSKVDINIVTQAQSDCLQITILASLKE